MEIYLISATILQVTLGLLTLGNVTHFTFSQHQYPLCLSTRSIGNDYLPHLKFQFPVEERNDD